MFKFKKRFILALLIGIPLMAEAECSTLNLNSDSMKEEIMMYSDQQYFEQLFDMAFNQSMPPDPKQLVQIGLVEEGHTLDLDTSITYFIKADNPYFGRVMLDYTVEKNNAGDIVSYRLAQISARMGPNVDSDLTTGYLENRFKEKFRLDTSGMGGVIPWKYGIHTNLDKNNGSVIFILTDAWDKENVSISTLSLSAYAEMTPMPKKVK